MVDRYVSFVLLVIFEMVSGWRTHKETRLHSSRMRTTRSLPYGGSLSGGDLCLGVSLSRVSLSEGVSVQGASVQGVCLCLGVSVQGSLSGGVSVHGGLC